MEEYLCQAQYPGFIYNHLYLCKHEELLRVALSLYPADIQYVPPEYITKSLAMLAVQNDPYTFEHIPAPIIDQNLVIASQFKHPAHIPADVWTQDLANISVTYNAYALYYVPQAFLNQKIIITAVSVDGNILHGVPDKYKTYEVVLAAVSKTGWALQHAPMFNDDDHIVTAALTRRFALGYVSERVRDDAAMVAIALRNDVSEVGCISSRLKNDVDFILQFPNLAQNQRYGDILPMLNTTDFITRALAAGWIYGYIPKEQVNNRKIVLELVKRCGMLLNEASDALRADAEIVMAALRSNSAAIKYAMPQLTQDISFMKEVLKLNGLAIAYMPAQHQHDYEVVKAAVVQNGAALLYCHEWRDDFNIVSLALNTDGSSLQYASARHKQNKELVLRAIKNASNVMLLVGGLGRLASDKQVMLEIIKKNKQAYTYAQGRLQGDPDIRAIMGFDI